MIKHFFTLTLVLSISISYAQQTNRSYAMNTAATDSATTVIDTPTKEAAKRKVYIVGNGLLYYGNVDAKEKATSAKDNKAVYSSIQDLFSPTALYLNSPEPLTVRTTEHCNDEQLLRQALYTKEKQ